MSEFNQLFTILYKDKEGLIYPHTHKDGHLYLSMTFSKAEEEKKRLEAKCSDYEYLVHSIEVNRCMFE